MNLNEVQALDYLLTAVQFKSGKKIDYSIVINYKNKLLTADFLPLNKESVTIRLESFDYDFDVTKKTVGKCFPIEIFTTWREKLETPFYTPEKIFSRPDLLLEKMISFISEEFSKTTCKEPVTKIIKNVHFLESDLKLDSMIMDNDEIQVISIIVNAGVDFIQI